MDTLVFKGETPLVINVREHSITLPMSVVSADGSSVDMACCISCVWTPTAACTLAFTTPTEGIRLGSRPSGLVRQNDRRLHPHAHEDRRLHPCCHGPLTPTHQDSTAQHVIPCHDACIKPCGWFPVPFVLSPMYSFPSLCAYHTTGCDV